MGKKIVSNSKSKLSLVLFGIIIIYLVLSFIKIDVFEVFIVDKGIDENKVILQVNKNEQDYFDVKWTHSVSLRPVIETYKVNDDYTISIEQMIFDSFSANLPASPDYDTIWEFHDEYIRVYNYDVTFDAVPVVIGKVVANHSFIYNEEETFLKDIYKPGGYVNIRVVNKSILKFLVKEIEIFVRN